MSPMKPRRIPLAKTIPLVLISMTEYLAPFVRMMAMSHRLVLNELGLASVMTATYGAFEQMTDFAISRFMFSAPREHFDDALASAHAMSVIRGLIVGAAMTISAPWIAGALSIESYWPDLACLGPIILIRSFEHLGPRVAERDYKYGAQFKIALLANLFGLASLGVALFIAPTHRALLAGLGGQMTMQVIASHALADTRYRISFDRTWLKRVFAFGLPLMINGIGLSLSSQGDRFIVAGLLGLSDVGIYSVAILATSVPLSMISRVTGTTLIAVLYNAGGTDSQTHDARLKVASQLLPLLAALNAFGIMLLTNLAIPLVFGQQFHVSHAAAALLGMAAFVRVVRGDPFTSMLINSGRTQRLAIANLSSAAALIFEYALIYNFRNFESAMGGRLCGEIVALIVTLIVTAPYFKAAMTEYLIAFCCGLALLTAGAIAITTTTIGESWITTLPAILAGMAFAGGIAVMSARNTIKSAFPKFFSPAVNVGSPTTAAPI